MRSRVWGVPLSQLSLISLIPLLLWVLFRGTEPAHLRWPVFIHFYQKPLFFCVSFYFLLTVAWVQFFRRGWFSSRWVLYVLSLGEILYEFYTSVNERDFFRMSFSLGTLIGLAFFFYRWLEKKVWSASLNPGVHWYEGIPRGISHITASIEINQIWYTAQLKKIDHQGLFLFLQNDKASTFSNELQELVPFKIGYSSERIEGEGRSAAFFYDPQCPGYFGIGLQFLPKNLYHFSEYTGLVEKLKGSGLIGN